MDGLRAGEESYRWIACNQPSPKLKLITLRAPLIRFALLSLKASSSSEKISHAQLSVKVLAMESVGSNSPPNAAPSPHPHIADRIARAFRHRLRLLHRAGPTFHVLGATANVYAVTLSAVPTCSCPDRATPCKHILFVLLRVLRLPLAHPALRRRSLRPCLLSRLLSSPTAPDSLAGPRARERFRQILGAGVAAAGEGKKAGACPVCLEEMEGEDVVVVTCGTCGNSLHGECLERWKRCCRGRRGATCVMCRARWRETRERREREQYVNLAAYVCEEDAVDSGGGDWSWFGGAAAVPG